MSCFKELPEMIQKKGVRTPMSKEVMDRALIHSAVSVSR